MAVLENSVGFVRDSRPQSDRAIMSLRGVERRSNLGLGQLEIASGFALAMTIRPLFRVIKTDITFQNPYIHSIGQESSIHHKGYATVSSGWLRPFLFSHGEQTVAHFADILVHRHDRIQYVQVQRRSLGSAESSLQSVPVTETSVMEQLAEMLAL